MTVKDHFGSDAFSANKRMFITIWHESNSANLRLNSELQKKFLELDGEAFTMIDNHWGSIGWTSVHFKYVEKEDFLAAVKAAYEFSAEKIAVKQKGTALKKTNGKKTTEKKSSTPKKSKKKSVERKPSLKDK